MVYKAVAAFKALKAAMAAGSGLASLMSGGWVAAIAAALGLATMLVTSLVGASAASADAGKIDYSGTIASLESYRDRVDSLVAELETLAAKTELTAAEQARADEIMAQLSGTSLSMKTALEGGGEGFETLGEKAAAARGEVERTEQAIRALNAAEALQALRDTEKTYATAVSEAQQCAASTAQYDRIYAAYEDFMREHPGGRYTQGYSGPMGTMASKEENFFVYAEHQANQPKPVWYSAEDKAAIQADRDFWAGIVAEMEQLGIDAGSSVEEIQNKMMEFDIAAGSYLQASGEKLSEAWQPIFDDLYTVMTDGTQFAQLPSFMQSAAEQYYEAYTGAIDQQAQLAEGDLMAMAADLTGYVQNMSDYMESNADFNGLVERFDALLQGPHTQESVDELNELLPLINEYIAAYNAMTEDTADDIPLIPEFTLESLQAVQEEAEAASEALATLNTTESLRKTLAAYKDGHGKWGIPYETKTGKKRMYFANWQKCRKEASACNDTINDVFMMHNHNRNSLEARLKAKVCELCGTTQGELFELHHVRKVKDLNGKERWEQCMIAKRRKTLVVCKPCHNAIHHGSKSQ